MTFGFSSYNMSYPKLQYPCTPGSTSQRVEMALCEMNHHIIKNWLHRLWNKTQDYLLQYCKKNVVHDHLPFVSSFCGCFLKERSRPTASISDGPLLGAGRFHPHMRL